jgi:hypothetical protein
MKAVPCISLFTEYIIQSYFAHFQSLFSPSSYSHIYHVDFQSEFGILSMSLSVVMLKVELGSDFCFKLMGLYLSLSVPRGKFC